ncbi:MAG: SMC-Scp complex subunit ScpB [Promethearchaeota archaeon]|jgi:segregation and condensation protein B
MSDSNKNLQENEEEDLIEETTVQELGEEVIAEKLGEEAIVEGSVEEFIEEELIEEDKEISQDDFDSEDEMNEFMDEKSENFDQDIDLEGQVESSNEDIATEAVELGSENSETVSKDEVSLETQLREFHRNLVEASLYAAGRPLDVEEISNKLDLPKRKVEELINEVAFDYLDRTTALVIAQIGDKYQMQIKSEYTEKVSKFAKGGAIAERYLRTLTIIALKQPILKSTVIKLRGSGAYEHVKYLIDNGFLFAVKKGRTHELTTTEKYADMFGLPKNIQQLKQAMVTQLGIEEVSSSEPQFENGEELTDETPVKSEEDSDSESQLENREDLARESTNENEND